MDNPLPSTEQEKLELQRKAYSAAVQNHTRMIPSEAMRLAELAYPNPPRPREIRLEGGSLYYRCVDCVIEVRDGDTWEPSGLYTAEKARALHDLLEHPNAS